MSKNMERRDFLKLMGAGAGTFGAASVGIGSTSLLHGQNPAMSSLLSPVAQGGQEEMDQHHQAGIQTFLDNIGTNPDFWGAPLEFTMDGDTKVFEITVSEIEWETEPDRVFPAMAYNGRVPGPEIRVTEGDNCRFVVTNEMTESTSIHWHGLIVPNSQDGVPFITQPPITPGETYTYEFTIRNSGSHMYHSHHNSAEQVTKGLLGAFIVEPKDTSREPEVDAEFSFILNDSTLGFTINGRSFPYTQPLVTTLGDKIRIRYMNEGLMIHPMHLHGMPQLVIAKDGWPLPVPYYCDTLNVAPGERYDVIVDCTELGAWAFHCHILTHAEARNGMFGMVTALIVNEA
jgi:FtsP/CotA-like multicopper oxidase with cupredoxin domain